MDSLTGVVLFFWGSENQFDLGGGEFLLLGGANQWFLGRKGINF